MGTGEGDRIASWKDFLSKACDKIEAGKEERVKVWPTEAPEFNIFNITHRSHYEVTTHSALLANLLDPNETHGQGALFLSPFLDRVGVEWPNANAGWTVDVEYDIAVVDESKGNPGENSDSDKYGRIDILLRFGDEAAIAIENKIWASDQEGQLFRYWRWLGENQFHKTQLVYLTPDGSEPSEFALEGANPDQREKILSSLKRLSYERDIFSLLTNVGTAIQAAPVKEVVNQYSMTLKTMLIGGRMSKLPETEYDFFKSKDNLTQLLPLETEFQKFRADVVERFRNNLEKLLKEIFKGNQNWVFSRDPDQVTENGLGVRPTEKRKDDFWVGFLWYPRHLSPPSYQYRAVISKEIMPGGETRELIECLSGVMLSPKKSTKNWPAWEYVDECPDFSDPQKLSEFASGGYIGRAEAEAKTILKMTQCFEEFLKMKN